MTRVLLLVLVPMLALGLLIASEAGYSPQLQRGYSESFDVSKRAKKLREKLKAVETNRPEVDDDGIPQAVVQDTEFDFGVLPPQHQSKHVFVVRNAGDADLVLGDGGKTCGCIGFQVDRWRVPPGEEVEVTLQWDTRLTTDEYRHGASLRTNDPNVPLIKFRVFGKIKTKLGGNPAEVTYTKIWPGQEETRETMIVSEVWESFELDDLRMSNSGFELMTRPLTDDELPPHALSGYLVSITTGSDLSSGNFQEMLTATGRFLGSAGEVDEVEVEIPVAGYVARPLTVIGPNLSDQGVINFGVLPPSESRSTKLTLRVNDPHTELRLIEQQVTPEFVQVKLEPFRPEKGLYFLTVTVPELSAEGSYTGSETGRIHLEFDHPRIDELDLDLTFVVLARP